MTSTSTQSRSTHRRRLAVLTALAVPALALVAPQAGAAGTAAGTTVGHTFAPDSTVMSCPQGYTWLQRASAGDGRAYDVPMAGVVTAFRYQVPAAGAPIPDSISFKLARYDAVKHYPVVVAATPHRGVPSPGGVLVVPTRIPAQAGDLIGLSSRGTRGGSCFRQAAGADLYMVATDAEPGTGVTNYYGQALELDLSADVETDVDGDGYGDVTQDACPTSAATQAACPAAPAPATTPATTSTTATGPAATTPAPKAKHRHKHKNGKHQKGKKGKNGQRGGHGRG